MTGRRVGRYELQETLGRGGQASVWRALETTSGRVVALKVLGRSVEPSAARRFAREAEILARLDHPNVVKLHEVVEADGCLATALEYVPGDDLGGILEDVRRLTRPPLRARELLALAQDLLSALHYVHGLDLVHRDVKPANVLVDPSGRAHLSDFGLARFRDLTHLTKTGQAVGTLRYMSPEQLRGEEVDRRSDLYQAGLVLYEMAWGALPFADDSPYAQAMARTTRDLVAPCAPPEGLAPAFVDVVRRSLARDPAARFADAAEFAQALACVAVQSGVHARPPDLRLPSAEVRAALRAAPPASTSSVDVPRERPPVVRRRLAPVLGAALGAGALLAFLLAPLPRGDGLEVARRELGRDRPLVAARELTVALAATTAPPSVEARRLLDQVAPRLPAEPEGRRAALGLLAALGSGALAHGPAAEAFARHATEEAEARAADGRTTDAERLLDRAWASGARSTAMALVAVRLTRGQGRLDLARAWVEAALSEDPGSPELRLKQSAIHADAGADGWAIAALRAGLKASPGHRGLTLRLADALCCDPSPALRAEGRSLVATGGGPEWSASDRSARLVSLATADTLDGLGPRAVEQALAAHALERNVSTDLALYAAYRINGECAKTLEFLERASREAPSDLRPRLRRELFRRSYWTGAPTIDRSLEQLREIDPAYAALFGDIWRASQGVVRTGQPSAPARLEDVRPAFERLGRESPIDPLFLVFEAQRHLDGGRPAEAERVVGKLMAIEPDCPPGFLLQAELARRRSDLAATEAFLRRSLRSVPHQRSVLDQLVGLLRRAGRHEDCLKLLDELLASRPIEPAYLLGRAVAVAALGRTDEAAAALGALLTTDAGRLEILRDAPGGGDERVPPDCVRAYVRHTAAPLLVELLAAAGRPAQALAAAEAGLATAAASLSPAPGPSSRQVGGVDADTARALAQAVARCIPTPPPELAGRVADFRTRAEATAERLAALHGRFQVGVIAYPGQASP